MTSRHLFRRRNIIDTWRHVEVRRDSDLKKGVLTSATVGFCTRCGAEKFIDPGESNAWICDCGSILKYFFCRPYEYAFLHLKFEQGTDEYIGQTELDDLGLKGWEAYPITLSIPAIRQTVSTWSLRLDAFFLFFTISVRRRNRDDYGSSN